MLALPPTSMVVHALAVNEAFVIVSTEKPGGTVVMVEVIMSVDHSGYPSKERQVKPVQSKFSHGNVQPHPPNDG